MTLIEALTEEQKIIISRSLDENYSIEESINDIDLIADLTELKIKLSKRINNDFRWRKI